MKKNEVASVVEKYLSDTRLDDIYFVVVRERIQMGDNSYRVPIRPSYLPDKLFRLYEFLAEYEVEIAEKENINALLTSGEPLVEEPELIAA